MIIKDWCGIKMVNGDIEKPLNLCGVEIHCKNAIRTRAV